MIPNPPSRSAAYSPHRSSLTPSSPVILPAFTPKLALAQYSPLQASEPPDRGSVKVLPTIWTTVATFSLCAAEQDPGCDEERILPSAIYVWQAGRQDEAVYPWSPKVRRTGSLMPLDRPRILQSPHRRRFRSRIRRRDSSVMNVPWRNADAV